MTDKSTIFLYEMLAMAFFSYGIISKENITLVFFIARLLCAPFTKGHLNPAATLAEFLLRNITLGETFVYWIGQLSGAFLGAFFNYLILGNLNAPEVDET